MSASDSDTSSNTASPRGGAGERLSDETDRVSLDSVVDNTLDKAINNEEDDERKYVKIHFAHDQAPFSWRKLFAFLGPGLFVSIGYIDPGNWATDIEGGSRFGYQLLWVLLMSNLMALLLQTLAARLGLVTERDLAQLCREAYPRWTCYALWVLCEIAITATDLAEVLGTAIGLNLLTGMPVIIGVVITAFDTLLFLLIQHFGIRKLELFIFGLLATVSSCFIIELFLVKPKLTSVLGGFIPRIDGESIYVAIGIIGATVMPHNFYLHSSLVQSRKIVRTAGNLRQAFWYNLIDCALSLNIAFFVNSSILIVAAAAFYPNVAVTQIQQAHDLLEGLLNSKLAPVVFGLGLVCAGQSSTLTGTLAGQIVMEGFVQLRIKPWIRRLVTRLIAVVPAVIVILLMGSEGTYKLLIFSQVVLSLQLPFAIVPLIKFTSSEKIMGPGGVFKNPTWVNVLAWLSALLIMAFNVFMLVTNFLIPMFEGPWWMVTAAIVLVLPMSVALVALLVYLVLRKDDSNPQYDNLVTRAVDAAAESESNAVEMSSSSSGIPNPNPNSTANSTA